MMWLLWLGWRQAVGNGQCAVFAAEFFCMEREMCASFARDGNCGRAAGDLCLLDWLQRDVEGELRWLSTDCSRLPPAKQNANRT
jgi:hypothetical protein